MLTSKAIINSDIETVWEILKDKVFQPQNYIPGIEDFEIKERDTNEFIRTLYTETDNVTELIIIDEDNKTITANLVKHTFLKGSLVNKVTATNEGTELTFEQDRQITLKELEGIDMQPALDSAVQQVKEIAEEK